MYPKIKEIRKSRKISQTDIAKAMGITQTAYSHYETGIRDISFEFAIKLADYYNISLDYLAGRTNIEKMQQNEDE